MFITLFPDIYKNIFLFVGLTLNLDWLVHEVGCPNFSSTNCYHNGGNFVYHNWGCILIYQLFSYPFRFLVK